MEFVDNTLNGDSPAVPDGGINVEETYYRDGRKIEVYEDGSVSSVPISDSDVATDGGTERSDKERLEDVDHEGPYSEELQEAYTDGGQPVIPVGGMAPEVETYRGNVSDVSMGDFPG